MKYIDLVILTVCRSPLSQCQTAQCTTPDFPGLTQISDRSNNQFNNYVS